MADVVIYFKSEGLPHCVSSSLPLVFFLLLFLNNQGDGGKLCPSAPSGNGIFWHFQKHGNFMGLCFYQAKAMPAISAQLLSWFMCHLETTPLVSCLHLRMSFLHRLFRGLHANMPGHHQDPLL